MVNRSVNFSDLAGNRRCSLEGVSTGVIQAQILDALLMQCPTKGVLYKKKMKKKQTLLVMLCMPVLLLPISLVAEGAADRFSDVRNHWGEPNISNWWRLGLVGGYHDGTFRPDNTVNRAEFISFLNRAFGYAEEA
jgi:hypothetical protein